MNHLFMHSKINWVTVLLIIFEKAYNSFAEEINFSTFAVQNEFGRLLSDNLFRIINIVDYRL